MIFRERTPEQEKSWQDWLAERPPQIRDMAARFPPNHLFRMKSTGHRCYPLSYAEDGTLTVAVTGEFNRILFSRNVFGISQDNLEPCELPAPGEDLGDTSAEAGYTQDDVRNILIPQIKAEREAHK